MYSIIVPVEKRNLISQSSVENTDGFAAFGAPTNYGSAAGTSVFGWFAGSVAFPASSGTYGAVTGSWQGQSGTDYTVSAYVYGGSGSTFVMAAGGPTGLSWVGSASFTTGGSWQRYSFQYTENSNTARRLVLATQPGNTAGGRFFFDGMQVEVGSITTYIDGDQPGCLWDGDPHLSTSYRSGTSRAGGTVYDLNTIGAIVLAHGGVGMPEVVNVVQPYALLAGAHYQRTHVPVRQFTLTFGMYGSTYKELHQIRRRIIDTLMPSNPDAPEAATLLYTGAGGTLAIDVVYDGGLELKDKRGFTEQAGVRLVAPDPYWRSYYEDAGSLAPNTRLGSANFMLRRDPNGVWGTMGISGASLNGTVRALANLRGTVMVAGRFTTAGGTASGNLAYVVGTTFGTIGQGTISGNIDAMVAAHGGRLYLGGSFTVISGTAGVRYFAQWLPDSSYLGLETTLGTPNGPVAAISMAVTGTLAIGGSWSAWSGVSADRHLLAYNGAGLANIDGSVNMPVISVLMRDDNVLFAGFDGLNNGSAIVKGSAAFGVAAYSFASGAWGTLGSAIRKGNGAGLVSVMGADALGRVWMAGHFDSAGGVSLQSQARYDNGNAFAVPYGTAYGFTEPSNDPIFTMVDLDSKNVVRASYRTDGMLVRGFGGTWVQECGPNLTNVRTVLTMPDRTLYVGGDFSGTTRGTVPSSQVIYNPGDAPTPVVMEITNKDTTQRQQVYHVINYTTGDELHFAGVLLFPGERITVSSQPGSTGITSSARGNMLSFLVPGSDLSSWRLAPGTNWIGFLAAGTPVQTVMRFQPRNWSSDGSATL